MDAEASPAMPASAWAPLGRPAFRSLWLGALASNIGLWVQNAAGSWDMTSFGTEPVFVALLQTASSLPVFLVGLPAAAFGDVFDRRKLLAAFASWMALVSLALAALSFAGALGPLSLLALTFALGLGAALSGPLWQSVLPSLVEKTELSSAVTLSGVAINIARAVGLHRLRQRPLGPPARDRAARARHDPAALRCAPRMRWRGRAPWCPRAPPGAQGVWPRRARRSSEPRLCRGHGDPRLGRIGSASTLAIAACLVTLGIAAAIPWKLGAAKDEEVASFEAFPEPVTEGAVEIDAGPVLVERRYVVRDEHRAEFLRLSKELEILRRRDGAMDWALYEDTAARQTLVEVFLVGSWAEHLRQHRRAVMADEALLTRIRAISEDAGVVHLVDTRAAC